MKIFLIVCLAIVVAGSLTTIIYRRKTQELIQQNNLLANYRDNLLQFDFKKLSRADERDFVQQLNTIKKLQGALDQYYFKHKSYPERLEQLTTMDEWLAGETIPNDIYTHSPLEYSISIAAGYMLVYQIQIPVIPPNPSTEEEDVRKIIIMVSDGKNTATKDCFSYEASDCGTPKDRLPYSISANGLQ